jgi:hypothetical protein
MRGDQSASIVTGPRRGGNTQHFLADPTADPD